jgi:glycosyltransferase involved in cell wall biosynthesis
MNKQVLVITYYWPPSGGAAVQRWLSFCNKLVRKGWDVHLLTVDEAHATFQLRDETLLKQVDPRIRVHTTKTKEPFKAYTALFGKKSIPKPAFSNESNPSFVKKVSRFIRGNFFIPDPRKGWKHYAVPKALELIQREGIPYVITAGPPHSTHFIGKELKKRTGIRWVADFHDLWTDVIYYDMLYHLPFVKKIDSRLERDILESADHIITVGDRYRDKLLSKSEQLQREKISILRIGYDEDLFTNRESIPQDEFVITYAGSIADYYHPEVFVHALKNVVDRHPNVPIKMRFVGVLADGIREHIVKSGLENILEEVGYVPHQESIRYLQKTTVLLLVNPVTKDEEMVIPGKVYEYLAAQKPIINITKETAETAVLIGLCKSGQTFNRGMQPQLEAYLTELIAEWMQKKNLDLQHDGNVTEQYSRGAITEELTRLLERR